VAQSLFGSLVLSCSFAMPETMEISDAAKSGDGTTQNVGIKVPQGKKNA